MEESIFETPKELRFLHSNFVSKGQIERETQMGFEEPNEESVAAFFSSLIYSQKKSRNGDCLGAFAHGNIDSEAKVRIPSLDKKERSFPCLFMSSKAQESQGNQKGWMNHEEKTPFSSLFLQNSSFGADANANGRNNRINDEKPEGKTRNERNAMLFHKLAQEKDLDQVEREPNKKLRLWQDIGCGRDDEEMSKNALLESSGTWSLSWFNRIQKKRRIEQLPSIDIEIEGRNFEEELKESITRGFIGTLNKNFKFEFSGPLPKVKFEPDEFQPKSAFLEPSFIEEITQSMSKMTALRQFSSLLSSVSGSSSSSPIVLRQVQLCEKYVQRTLIESKTIPSFSRFSTILKEMFRVIDLLFSLFQPILALDPSNLSTYERALVGSLHHYVEFLPQINAENDPIVGMYFDILGSLCPVISNVIFRGDGLEILLEKYKINVSSTNDYELKTTNVPAFLEPFMFNITLCFQNLYIIKTSNTEVYNELTRNVAELKLFEKSEEINEYIARMEKYFKEKERAYLSLIEKTRKRKEEEQVEEMKTKVQRLRNLKRDYQAVVEEFKMISRKEQMKRAEYLEQIKFQMSLQKVITKYSRELEKEWEKSLLMDIVAVENEPVMARTKKFDIKKALEDILVFEQQPEGIQVKRENPKMDEEEKEGRPRGNWDKKSEEKQFKPEGMQIEAIGNEKLRQGNKVSPEWASKGKEKLNWQNSLREPELQRIREVQRGNGQIGDLEQKLGGMEIIEDEVGLGTRDLSLPGDPPANSVFEVCINSYVIGQADLTNRIVLQMLLGNHDFVGLVQKFKMAFLCQKGDLADRLVERIVSESSEVNTGVIRQMNFFDEFGISNIIVFQPKKHNTLHLPKNILSFALHEEVQVTSKLECPLKLILTDNIISIYFEIFSHLIKFRHLSLIQRKNWKFITRFASVMHEKHSQLGHWGMI